MIDDIILIGPMNVGKGTQGKLLAEALALPQCSMDDLRWDYYQEIGYSHETAKAIAEAEGFEGVYRYWKPFEIHAVERLVAERRGCVIDFGAGHSVFEDPALLERAKEALAGHRNVVLLMPSPDPDESVRILRERMGESSPEGFDFIAHFVTHPSNHALATHVVYTAGRTPEETRDDILAAIKAPGVLSPPGP